MAEHGQLFRFVSRMGAVPPMHVPGWGGGCPYSHRCKECINGVASVMWPADQACSPAGGRVYPRCGHVRASKRVGCAACLSVGYERC